MDTITDKYDEAVDRATSHLQVVKPKLSSIEIEWKTRTNIFGRRGWFSQQENSNEKTWVTMSTSGAESAHVQNKYPNDGGCQIMEIEYVRKEKTIKKV